MVRAIIIDDEPNSIDTLKWKIENFCPQLTITETFSDPVQALDHLRNNEVDLVFLDIEMPNLSGFDVLEALGEISFDVIFTTAYDRFAVTAFELNAVDYLLKPFSRDRFLASVERLREQFETAPNHPDSGDQLRNLLSPQVRRSRLFVRSRGRVTPLLVDDIIRLEAQDDYVMIHTADARHLVRVTLKDMLEQLDPGRFIQIHRSHVANLDFVRVIEPYDGHRLSVSFTDGERVVASKTGSKPIRELTL